MTTYEVTPAHEVVEVVTGELSERRVVFAAIDEGSAHAVARALADYWSDPVGPEQWNPPETNVYAIAPWPDRWRPDLRLVQ